MRKEELLDALANMRNHLIHLERECDWIEAQLIELKGKIHKLTRVIRNDK